MPARIYTMSKRTSRAPQILSMVEESPGGIRTVGIAKALGISHQLASIHLVRMAEAGKVEQVERGLYCMPGRATELREALAAEDQKLIDRYLAGESVLKIAKDVELDYRAIYHIFRKAGIELRGRGRTHGKPSTYQSGCRCDICTDANTARHTRARRERAERGTVPIHGSASSFSNYGCHCDLCVEAHRAKVRDRIKSDFDTSNSKKPWTPEELRYVLAKKEDGRRYVHTARECAIHLKRKVSAIDGQRHLYNGQS